MSAREFTASFNEVSKTQRFKAAAVRRLENAKRNVEAAKGRPASVAALAFRELSCAMAVAEEWGVVGKAGWL